MKLTKGFYLTCIFLFASFTPDLYGQQDADSMFNIGDSLARAGNDFEAAIAYERIYFFATQPEVRLKANLARANALKRMGLYQKAKNDLQRSIHTRQFPQQHFKVLYHMAFMDYMSGNYSSAISMLKQLDRLYPESSTNEDVIFLSALANIMAEDWVNAKKSTKDLLSHKISDSIELANWHNKTTRHFSEENLPEEISEKRAALLAAIIPGSGHMYSGHIGKGLLNISSQLLSLSAAGLMGYQGLYVSGFIMGLGTFQNFYFGGIRQATFLAHQRNLNDMAQHKEELKNFIMEIHDL